MGVKFTSKAFAREVELYRCEHCEEIVPRIFFATAEASFSGDTDIFTGKVRNQEERLRAIELEANQNAQRKMEASKRRHHRCLKCGNFSSEYLHELRTNYDAYRKDMQGRIYFYYFIEWPIIATCIVGITWIFIFGISEIIRAIRLVNDNTLKSLDHLTILYFALIPLPFWVVYSVYKFMTQIEYSRPYTEQERNEWLDRSNLPSNAQRWLDNLSKHEQTLKEILEGDIQDQRKFFTTFDESAYGRWSNFEQVISYCPERW
jgi:hypothetical protein